MANKLSSEQVIQLVITLLLVEGLALGLGLGITIALYGDPFDFKRSALVWGVALASAGMGQGWVIRRFRHPPKE